MAEAFGAGFREFCGGVQHAVSGHRILLFFINSRLIRVSSVKVWPPPEDAEMRADRLTLALGGYRLFVVLCAERADLPREHLLFRPRRHPRHPPLRRDTAKVLFVWVSTLRMTTGSTRLDANARFFRSSQADDVRDRVDGFVFLLYQVGVLDV